MSRHRRRQARTAARKSEKRMPRGSAYADNRHSVCRARLRVNTSMFDEAPSGEESLDAIQADLKDCRRCKLAPGRTNLVFGSGNPHAELMFVGEAPGAEEDAQGLAFCRPRRSAADQDHRGNRDAQGRCVYLQHSQMPSSRQQKSGDRRNRFLREISCFVRLPR